MAKIVQYIHPGAAFIEFFPWSKPFEFPLFAVQEAHHLVARNEVRYIPSWFPGAGFKKEAVILKEMISQMINKPFDRTKSDIVS